GLRHGLGACFLSLYLHTLPVHLHLSPGDWKPPCFLKEPRVMPYSFSPSRTVFSPQIRAARSRFKEIFPNFRPPSARPPFLLDNALNLARRSLVIQGLRRESSAPQPSPH